MNIVRVFLVKQSPLVTCSAGQRYSLFTYPITQYVLSDSVTTLLLKNLFKDFYLIFYLIFI